MPSSVKCFLVAASLVFFFLIMCSFGVYMTLQQFMSIAHIPTVYYDIRDYCSLDHLSHASLDRMHNVENKLHVHRTLWNTGTTSMNDRYQSAVKLIHVALRKEPSSRTSLVLHHVSLCGDSQ